MNVLIRLGVIFLGIIILKGDVNTLTNSSDYFLVWDRGELYILHWDGEESILSKLESAFLESGSIPLAGASYDGDIIILMKPNEIASIVFNLALLDRNGDFIRYLTDFDAEFGIWDYMDISSDNQYIITHAGDRVGFAIIKSNPDTPASEFIRINLGATPTISYDGRYIVYSEGWGAEEYALKLIDLGEEYQYKPDSEISITSELQLDCFYPDFHPSQYQVAYFCFMGRDTYSIFITDIITAETRFILTPQEGNLCVRWSPDGERLAFNSRDTMYILTLETMELEEIPVDVSLLSDNALPICPVWLNW